MQPDPFPATRIAQRWSRSGDQINAGTQMRMRPNFGAASVQHQWQLSHGGWNGGSYCHGRGWVRGWVLMTGDRTADALTPFLHLATLQPTTSSNRLFRPFKPHVCKQSDCIFLRKQPTRGAIQSLSNASWAVLRPMGYDVGCKLNAKAFIYRSL